MAKVSVTHGDSVGRTTSEHPPTPEGMVLVGYVDWDGDEFHDFRYAPGWPTWSNYLPVYVQKPDGYDPPCPHCDDTGWVEDKNWQPEFAGQRREQENGLIPCGALPHHIGPSSEGPNSRPQGQTR
jgi:hypothetical protein